MKSISQEQALHRLAAYCSRGERCISDIRKKMIQWDLPENSQKIILNKLQQEKFLDEKRFCKAFVNDKIKYNKWGSLKIKYELKKKNIPEPIINDILSEVNLKEIKEQLSLLLLSKRKTVKGKNNYEIKQKLIRFAVGRGYTLEDIQNALSLLEK